MVCFTKIIIFGFALLSITSCSNNDNSIDKTTYDDLVEELVVAFDNQKYDTALKKADLLLEKKNNYENIALEYRAKILFVKKQWEKVIIDLEKLNGAQELSDEALFQLIDAYIYTNSEQKAVALIFSSLQQSSDLQKIESNGSVYSSNEYGLYKRLIDLSIQTGNYSKIHDYLVNRIKNNYASEEILKIILEAFKYNNKTQEYDFYNRKWGLILSNKLK